MTVIISCTGTRNYQREKEVQMKDFIADFILIIT